MEKISIIPKIYKRLNKMLFFKDLEYFPHPGQFAIHNSKAKRRVVACGVRWGKTRCAAMEGLCAAMEPKKRSIGWVVAPTYDLADKVFREIVVLTAEHLPHRIQTLKEGDKRLVLRNLAGGVSEIRAKSADNPISLLGEGLDWLIVDEAAQLHRKVWESYLSQRLIDKNGWALLISTPKGKNWFFGMYQRGLRSDPECESFNHASWENPHLQASLIEKERSRLPEAVFNQEYAAQFVEGAGSVFRKVREAAVGQFKDPVKREWYYAGLDLAKVNDFTVLTIVNYFREVVYIDRFNRLDWNLQISRIKEAVERYRNVTVYVDSSGVGDPIFESLLRENINARPYRFTHRSKTDLVSNLSILFEKGLITLPKPEICPELIDELEAFQFSVTDAGSVRTGAVSGAHDDCVISLALAMISLPPLPEIPPGIILPDPNPLFPEGEEW